MTDDDNKINQCKSCPWRVDCDPMTDIPNYVPNIHCNLDKTIQSGLGTLFQKERHIMACHYSKPGEEFPCAGWLHNQIGPGNNLGVRLLVMTGKMSPPVVDGLQYETFEETLCNTPIPEESATNTASSTQSLPPGASARTVLTAALMRSRRGSGNSTKRTTSRTKRPRA